LILLGNTGDRSLPLSRLVGTCGKTADRILQYFDYAVVERQVML
jgi:hypothetical protein